MEWLWLCRWLLAELLLREPGRGECVWDEEWLENDDFLRSIGEVGGSLF